jgi:hypothetical protein
VILLVVGGKEGGSVARDAQDARAVTEVDRPAQPTTETRHESEWRWLGIVTVGGALLGALILGVLAYATTDSGTLFSRGDVAFYGAVIGFFGGLIAGFVLWALGVLFGRL